MSAAIYDTMTIEVEAGSPSAQARPYLFRASGSRVRFPGFLAVYSGGPQGPSGDGLSGANQENGVRRPGGAEEVVRMPARDELAEQERLPAVAVGESLDLLRLIPEQHFTQPPPRYTEGTLVKALEENGIGRPSTYAAIISTIIERGYVQRSERRLSPTELGFTVNDLLVKHFDSIFNVGFTAEMEEHLDSISRGEEEMVPVLRRFYYGSFEPQLQRASDEMEKVSVGPEKLGEPCPECGGDLIVKAGKFGKFVGCANYPKCRYTRPILNRIGIACPKDGGAIVERRTRQGRIFFGCENYPACDFTSWKRPLDVPCDSCGGLMVVASKAWAECSVCQKRSKLRPSAAEDEQSDQTEVAA
jgi:DNA topoisomerase-1